MSDQERHMGRNISRVRELLGVKQEALAFAVGISQQSISILEKSASVDPGKLKQIASGLGVSCSAIQNFDEKKILAYFENAGDTTSNLIAIDAQQLFKRLIDAFEANSKLQDEKQSLYERLLQTEQEKYRNLEKIAHYNQQGNGN